MKEKVLFDTNVLVAGIVKFHPHFNRANPWLRKVVQQKIELIVASHSLAEVYAVLTNYPVKPRFAPGTINRIIQEDIVKYAKIVALTGTDYLTVIRRLSEQGIVGGMIYDALILRAAQKEKVSKILTLNPEHFQRIWQEGKNKIIEP